MRVSVTGVKTTTMNSHIINATHDAPDTPSLVNVGPNSGDDIVIMMSGAKGATRCVSSNDGAYCAAGTANIGSCASSRRIGDGRF